MQSLLRNFCNAYNMDTKAISKLKLSRVAINNTLKDSPSFQTIKRAESYIFMFMCGRYCYLFIYLKIEMMLPIINIIVFILLNYEFW